jgi:hypothetical protein
MSSNASWSSAGLAVPSFCTSTESNVPLPEEVQSQFSSSSALADPAKLRAGPEPE